MQRLCRRRYFWNLCLKCTIEEVLHFAQRRKFKFQMDSSKICQQSSIPLKPAHVCLHPTDVISTVRCSKLHPPRHQPIQSQSTYSLWCDMRLRRVIEALWLCVEYPRIRIATYWYKRIMKISQKALGNLLYLLILKNYENISESSLITILITMWRQ